ncbi:CinA family protein [Kitasatospora sp. NPDC085895]|uniref:CinA family protein n=1 Tax=Kitasatospora sp. NPDC085895 TaxID=3155057 RepID=UPI00344FD050
MSTPDGGAAQDAAQDGSAGDGLAERAHAALRGRSATVAVAESLTGGLLAAALVDVPGASATFRGSVTAYATDLKASVLGVDEGLLAVHGPVHPVVARQMAEGVRTLLGATYGLATTGVAGPEPQDGVPVGTVHIGFAGPTGTRADSRVLSGQREIIRRRTVTAALELLLERLASDGPSR